MGILARRLSSWNAGFFLMKEAWSELDLLFFGIALLERIFSYAQPLVSIFYWMKYDCKGYRCLRKILYNP